MTHNHTRHNALRRALPLLLGALFAGPALADKADPVGEVSTAFKLFGPNHKILVEAFDDPRIDGVACYLARPKTGGVKGGLGLAESGRRGVRCQHLAGVQGAESGAFLRQETQCTGLPDLQHQTGGWFVQECSQRRSHYALGTITSRFVR